MPLSTYAGAAYELLDIAVADGVAVMTIHHEHTACVLTLPLNMEITTFVDAVEADDAVRVIVLRS